MAALSAMAANVAHEVGNPLAVIAGLAQQLPDAPGAAAEQGRQLSRTILEQTARIAQMMRQIADFSAAGSGAAEHVDVNAMVKAVCDFQTFDRRYRGTAIEFRPGEQLPARELVPDHLNEVMMGLLQASIERGGLHAAPRRVVVETALRGDDVVIRIACHSTAGAAASAHLAPDVEARIALLRRRVVAMGGRLTIGDAAFEVDLPSRTR